MPRFPSYDAHIGLDVGQAQRVDTNAEAVGQGMQRLGAGISDLGQGLDAYQQLQERQQRYDTNLSYDNLIKQQANIRDNLVRNQQPGAAGLMDQGMKAFDDGTAEWMKANVPPPLRPEFAQRLQSARTAFAGQYANDQATGRGQYEMQTNAQGVVDDQNAVGNQPDAVKTVLQNRFAQIDAMSVSPAEKLALKATAQRALAQTYLQSKHGTDVPGASQVLGVAVPGGVIPSSQSGKESVAMSYFMGRGYSRAQAAGIVGNLVHESGGLKTQANNPGDGSDGTDSIGIAQWNSDRARNLKAFAASQGKDWHDFGVQLAFVDHELNTGYAGVKQKLLAAQSPDEAAGVIVTGYERPQGSEGGAAAAHGWSNRRDQARRLAGGDFQPGDLPASGSPSTTSPLFSVFTPMERQQMFAGVQANAAQDRGQVQSLIKDDIASMEATGQGSSLTPQRVANSLGQDAADSWLQQRARAKNFYSATSGLEGLPAEAVQQKLSLLAPQPGQAGFVEQQADYFRAQKIADAVMQQRSADPAGSVDNLPDVRQAASQVSPQNPASYGALVKARLAAQTRLGIPENMQSPMSYSEAQDALQPLLKALPGQEKQAVKDTMAVLTARYGDKADEAMSYLLGQYKADAATKAIVGSIFRKIGLGQPVTREDARAFDDAGKTDASNQAVAGILGPNQGPFPTPDTQAIDMLRGNPALAPKFDQAYGPGRAAQVLQFNAAVPAPAPAAAPPPPDPNVRPQSDWQPTANFDQGGTFKAPDLPPPPKPAGRTPTSGSDAFQQQKQIFEQGTAGGDGFGGSGVGM
jgi:hypothetical protein